MKKIMCKRIMGLLIFTIAFLCIGLIPTYAEESSACKQKVQQYNDDLFLLRDRYGLNMEFDIDNNQYVITMAKVSSGSIISSLANSNKLKFKIAEISYYTSNGTVSTTVKDSSNKNTTVTYTPLDKRTRVKKYEGDNEISALKNYGIASETTIKPKGSIKIKREQVSDGFEVVLVPDGFNDPDLASVCTNSSFKIYLDVEVEAGSEVQAKVISYSGGSGSSAYHNYVDCSGDYASRYTDKNSFEYNFCYDKEKALADSNTKKISFSNDSKGKILKYGDSKEKPLEFKCDWKNTIVPGDNVTDYYVNKKYVIGTGTIEITEDNYEYHTEYTPGSITTTSDAKCKINCEEVVKVEYGPPISTKNGFCFEYKVKVTSRINCELKEGPTPPKDAITCTPTPYCIHKSGYESTEGGPNKQFDSCVKSCDGGKYTSKCSKKCYKKVYGKSVARKTSNDGINLFAQKMASVNDQKLYTYIYLDSESDKRYRIVWKNDVDRRNNDGRPSGLYVSPTDSYWHYLKGNDWGRSTSYYSVYERGIPKTTSCTSDCYWVENSDSRCKSDDSNVVRYLNDPEVYELRNKYLGTSDKSPVESDKEKNEKKFEQLKARCEAYASCNTKTAEFTISVDYTQKGNNKKVTIDFPYSTGKDTITATNKTNDEVKCTSKAEENKSIFLSYAGCYGCGKTPGDKRWYQTEWTFPGTWVHLKTGKITYDASQITDSVSWKSYDNYFCLPMDLKEVNTNWYKYYIAKVYSNDPSMSWNGLYSEFPIIECPNGEKKNTKCISYYKEAAKSTFTDKDIDWNIHAAAKNFGMFEWDINIDCFYAYDSAYPGDKNCDIECKKSDSSGEAYEIRTPDLTNLFPDSEGNKLASPDKTGRAPGFNWNQYSSQVIKDTEYKSQPSNYAKWVQAKGYGVYSDEYLDYEVVLTKEIINELKKKDKKYTNWEGKTEINSVVNYQSPLFRNGGILSGSAKYPNGEALKCNNMKNYKSSECQEFVGEGN